MTEKNKKILEHALNKYRGVSADKTCYVPLIQTMKILDLESYDFWNKKMKLYYCIYSVTFNEMRFISHVALKNLVKGCNIKQFHDFTPYDKKEYYEIPFKEL